MIFVLLISLITVFGSLWRAAEMEHQRDFARGEAAAWKEAADYADQRANRAIMYAHQIAAAAQQLLEHYEELKSQLGGRDQ